MISSKLLDELKTIFREDYGVELKPQEVSEIGNTLVNYFSLLLEIEARESRDKNYDNENETKQNRRIK